MSRDTSQEWPAPGLISWIDGDGDTLEMAADVEIRHGKIAATFEPTPETWRESGDHAYRMAAHLGDEEARAVLWAANNADVIAEAVDMKLAALKETQELALEKGRQDERDRWTTQIHVQRVNLARVRSNEWTEGYADALSDLGQAMGVEDNDCDSASVPVVASGTVPDALTLASDQLREAYADGMKQGRKEGREEEFKRWVTLGNEALSREMPNVSHEKLWGYRVGVRGLMNAAQLDAEEDWCRRWQAGEIDNDCDDDESAATPEPEAEETCPPAIVANGEVFEFRSIPSRDLARLISEGLKYARQYGYMDAHPPTSKEVQELREQVEELKAKLQPKPSPTWQLVEGAERGQPIRAMHITELDARTRDLDQRLAIATGHILTVAECLLGDDAPIVQRAAQRVADEIDAARKQGGSRK